MTREEMMGQLRHLLSGIGAILVTKGVTDAGMVEVGIGAVMFVAMMWWSWKSKRPTP